MPQYSRFYDLRETQLVWDLPLAYVEPAIATPHGEELYAVNLPNASLCADFLIVEDIRLWAGVTIAVHQTDIDRVKSAFQLATDAMVRFISPAEAKHLPRYQNEGDWWWLEVSWAREQRVQMVRTQTNGALWYCKNSANGQQHAVVLALEGVDRMRAEVEGDLSIPAI